MPEIFIPPFTVQEMVTQLSEVVDYGVKMLGADQMWEKYTGKNMKIGILDTGIDVNHPDLAPNIAAVKSFVGDDGKDVNGHGTHCAGIIAGCKNGSGIVGIAPDAQLYIAKVLNNDGTGGYMGLVDGIRWLIEQDVNVISMSIGTHSMLPWQLEDAIIAATTSGIIFVVAAGNEGAWGEDSLSTFAKYDNVLAIGAVDSEKNTPYWSSRGPEIDFAAPGVDVYSCFPPSSYAKLSGTSMATPAMAAVISLLIEKEMAETGHRMTKGDLVQKLMKLSEDIGPVGFDTATGNGLVDLSKLFTTPPPSAAPQRFWRVQFGPYTKDDAAMVVNNLKDAGISSMVKNYGLYYAVQVGAYGNPENAKARLDVIEGNGYINCYIIYL